MKHLFLGKMEEKEGRKNRKFLLMIAMIIGAFVLIVSLASLYTQDVISCGRESSCAIPLPFLIPIIASVSLLVGSFIGYLMVGKLSRKEHDLKGYAEMMRRIFSDEEYKILNAVAGSKEISQAGLAQKTGLSRLKVFRTLEKLKEKGLIEKEEKDGKMRMIRMNENYRELFR
jgi:DNA-binding MarR family transcriptional regulator